MALSPGTRFGSYEIAEAIGAGGMGEVYRATDTALKRDVAIKVLPESFSDDADRLARFQREAEVLASLNHSNIAQIYGLEKAGTQTVIVMELVEGPTLADHIAEGPIAPDEALGIARQIANALEAAHGAHVVHRDLKPANVKLRDDGTVKVLDFGIAKAIDARAISGGHSPVMTTPAVTETGVILGTAAYMSPEQARGKLVDQRTDIWAFGCLLFEMLTGQPAFGGEDVMATLARVIDRDTDLSSMPGTISPAVRHTIKLCLEKDPNKRISDIRDVRLALEGVFGSGSERTSVSAVAPRSLRQRVTPIAAAALITAVTITLVGWTLWPDPPLPPVSRFSQTVPENQVLQGVNAVLLDITPDGRAFTYNTTEGLRLRRLEDLDSQLIPGTTEGNSRSPAFSPDGQSLLQFSIDRQQLQRISVSGGAPVVLADWRRSANPSATWGNDGSILYSVPDGILRVPETGGVPELIVEAGENESLFRPRLLPGGDSVLFSVRQGTVPWDTGQIVVESLTSGERTVIVDGGTDGRYLPTGHVVYAFEDGLFGVAFDHETATVSGGAVPLLQGVQRALNLVNPSAHFAVANSGTLVYLRSGAPSGGNRTLVWVNRDGTEEPLGVENRNFTYVRVSPDGNRIAASVSEGGPAIWVSDVARPVLSHTTNVQTTPGSQTWTADNRRLIFPTGTAGGRALSWTLADGTGEVEVLMTLESFPFVSPGGRTPDGSSMVFTYGSGSAQPSIGLLSLEANAGGEHEWHPLIDRATGASAASVSPDGEWIAYHTDDTGQYGVYIERFPELGDRRLISDADGGWGARWSPAGDEIFYRRLGDGAMMAVPLQAGPSLEIGTPEFLFDSQGYIPPTTPSAGGGSSLNWDLAPDGRFLMIKSSAAPSAARDIIIVQNWFEELNRLVPTK